MLRSTHATSKVTYNVFDHLYGEDLCNAVSQKNPTAILKNLMDLCFNHNKGIIQQKGVLLHAMLRNKYTSNDIMELYKQREPSDKITYPKDALTDCRIFSELPVLSAYIQQFSPDNIHITFDKVNTTFDKQKQTNPDYIVNIISKYGLRNTYQDVKSGIFRNHTRGSLGILTYDKDKNIIPFTNKDFTLEELDLESINKIKLGLDHDFGSNNSTFFYKILDKAKNTLHDSSDLFQNHNNMQRLLWDDIQSNPKYNRSVSFRFPIMTEDIPETSRYTAYKQKFTSLLGNRSYDLNRLQDRKDIFMAMLRAYRDIDPDIIKKIQHMASVGRLEYDPLFLQTMADIIKKSI